MTGSRELRRRRRSASTGSTDAVGNGIATVPARARGDTARIGTARRGKEKRCVVSITAVLIRRRIVKNRLVLHVLWGADEGTVGRRMSPAEETQTRGLLRVLKPAGADTKGGVE
jgi:hypothetical protein